MIGKRNGAVTRKSNWKAPGFLVSSSSHMCSWFSSLAALGTIYVFWTVPLTSVAAYANSENLTELFPDLEHMKDSYLSAELLSAMIVALLFAGFLA